MKALSTREASVILFLLQTYCISCCTALSSSAVRHGFRAGIRGTPTNPRDVCRSSTPRRSPALVMPFRRRHPTTVSVARMHASLQQGPPLFRRTRPPNADHSSERDVVARLSSSEQGSTVFSSPETAGAAALSGGIPDAARPASGSAADPSSAPAGSPSPLMAMKWGLEQLQRIRRQLFELPEDTAEEARFLIMAALTGVITGTAVTIFKTLISIVKEFAYTDVIRSAPPGAASTCIGALTPIVGALGVVSIMPLLQLKSYGPGLGGLTEEVDRQVPWIPKRTLGKTLAAVATLGTGNSLGPEGPAVELGVASSRYVSSISNLSVQRQRMLLGAGAAAGVAAGFNAPIAGIFFALEIVKDTLNTNHSSKSFIAATLLCAVVSALMAKIGLHDELSLRPAAYNLESPLIELPLYLGLGVVAGLVAVMFKFFSRKSAEVFKGNFPGFEWMKTVPQWSKPLMMSAVTGLFGVFFPQVLFFGYDTLDKLLANTGSYSLPLLCFLCVAKALLTAGALGSGLVGGTFAPSLFLGATAGAAYQRILQGSLTAFKSAVGPHLDTSSAFLLPVTLRLGIGGPGGVGDLSSLLTIAGSPAYAMVGAAAVLSALYRAPLTGSLLLFELTKDYDIVLPLMAAAGVSSLVVELFSRADTPAVQPMPRDMSLEIGLKISGKVDKLMGKIQVTEALVPRVLTLTTDTSLSEAMRAFRLTRNEFAIVVGHTGFQAFEAPPPPPPPSPAEAEAAGQTGTNGDVATGWHAQTILAEDMWERRDLKLVGVLALREIILALDLERARYSDVEDSGGEAKPELTAGSVCRRDCFTVKASTDIMQAKRLMNLKGIRFLPVVVDLPMPASSAAATPPPPPSPAVGTATSPPPLKRRLWSNNRGNDVAWKRGEGSRGDRGSGGGGSRAVVPPPPPPPPPQAVVGVLSRESVRIAGRLTETERAISDRPAYAPPPAMPPAREAGES